MGAGVWSTECQLRFRLPKHSLIFLAELFATDKASNIAVSTTYDRIIFLDPLSSHKAMKLLETTKNVGKINCKLYSANDLIKYGIQVILVSMAMSKLTH